MRNRLALALGLILPLILVGPASAQITVPFPTFVTGETINPDEVNANFAKFSDALNRTGGVLTGQLTTQVVVPDGNNTRDLGASGTRYANMFTTLFNASGAATFGSTITVASTATLSGTLDVAGAATFSTTLAVSAGATLGTATVAGTGANAIDVAGGITAGSGNVAIVDTSGRIPAISSTYFASLDGSALTGVTATELLTVTTQTTTYTALTTDRVIIANGASFTITLYGCSGGNVGRALYVKNIHASGVVTVDAEASETIDGSANFTLDGQYFGNLFICASTGAWLVF